jgi:membrane protein
MNGALQSWFDGFNRFVWSEDFRDLRGWRGFTIKTLRLLYVVVRDLLRGELNLRAMSLVYTSLLSLVPLLAVSFSVLKAFGVHNKIQPLLEGFLTPIGPKGVELAGKIVNFVEGIKVGLLGSIGVGLLIYTGVTLLQKIEAAFNFVWQIDSLRSFGHRLRNYLSVIVIGPVLVFSALGITASVMNTALVQKIQSIEPFGSLMFGTSKLVPYVLVWMAFTMIYVFVPNTRVKLSAAAVGGLLAAIAWQTTGWGFAAFIASSARYAKVYSSFAILILALIWLYLNWLILLVGAQISFYMQNPQFLVMQPVSLVLSNRLRERLALVLMFLIGYNHYHDRAPWTLDTLIDHLELSPEPVHRVLLALRELGYVEETADNPPAFLPAKDIGTIELRTLLSSVRRGGESRWLNDERVVTPPPVDEALARLQLAMDETLRGENLRDLVCRQTLPSREVSS